MSELRVIAKIHSDFPEKFGIPRQPGIIEGLSATVVFEPEFCSENALRGIEGFSHLWLIWGFSANEDRAWSPVVRPPRLGGNVRMGVFATRSPNRPNPLGLSCVRLTAIEKTKKYGVVLHISGADMMDGSPVFDIKPYLSYADCRPDAVCGFAPSAPETRLEVEMPPKLMEKLPEEKRKPLLEILASDPRPAYQRDPERVYGLKYAGFNLRFKVSGERVTVIELSAL